MAQLTTVLVPARTWTKITNAAASAATFQNDSLINMKLKGTVTDSAPTDELGAITYPPFTGRESVTFSDLFPHPASVAYLWVYFPDGNGSVMVSHVDA